MVLSRLSLAAALGFVFVLPALAQQTLQVDPAHSTVEWTLSDPLHPVKGTFHVEGSSVTFDESGHMAGAVIVNAASGDSGNASRDKKMTRDQMQASKYSTVTFDPTGYTGSLAASGDSTITVSGNFALLGKPHAISVPMKVHLADGQLQATGSFVVPYVQWGMKDPSNFLLHVGKEVTVNLTLAGPVTPAQH